MRFVLAGLVLAAGLTGQAPPVPSPPADLPKPRAPQWGKELARGSGMADAPLGVGHLRPATGQPNVGHTWLKESLMPLYRSPGGPHWGWLARGWLLSKDGSRRPFPASCLVETTYESSSIDVSAWRDDGWLRIAAEKPCAGEEGALWSHRTLLDYSRQKLEAELWQEFFFRDDVSPLSFRQEEIPHALRAGPNAGAKRITWIGADHSIEPLAVEGAWMRVRVFQPSNYCAAPEDWQGLEHEGWVRWRDAEKGPWLFVWSRGC